MRYKRTTIIVKRTDSKKYSNLHTNWPYSCKIKDKEWPDNKEDILIRITEYLLDNPYRRVVFKNNIPEEKAFGKTLDDLVDKHNLILKLGKGANFFRRRKAKQILKEVAKENGKR